MDRKPLIPGRQQLSAEIKADWRKRDVRSRLAAVRRRRRLSQERMAHYTGLSLAAYRRLENKEVANPPLRNLVNCALVLGVELSVLIEDEWTEFAVFSKGAPKAPPDDLHGSERISAFAAGMPLEPPP